MKKIIAVIMIWGFSFNAFSKNLKVLPKHTNIWLATTELTCVKTKRGTKIGFSWSHRGLGSSLDLRLSDFTKNHFERVIQRKDGSKVILSIEYKNYAVEQLIASLQVTKSNMSPIKLTIGFQYGYNEASNVLECNKNLQGQKGLSVKIYIRENN